MNYVQLLPMLLIFVAKNNVRLHIVNLVSFDTEFLKIKGILRTLVYFRSQPLAFMTDVTNIRNPASSQYKKILTKPTQIIIQTTLIRQRTKANKEPTKINPDTQVGEAV